MPAPGSIIPSSEPVDFVTAISRPGVPPGRARALVAYKPSVSETEFKKRFPSPYRVRGVTIYGGETGLAYRQKLLAVPGCVSVCLTEMGTDRYSEGFLYGFCQCTTKPPLDYR